jgi:outer membrane protein insertion porin family
LNRDVLTFASRREEASLQWSQKLSKHTTVLGRYSYRRVATSDVVIPSLLVPQLLQPVRIGILSGSFVQDHRDNPTDAHKGMYNAVDGGVASSFLGSQRDFARVLGRNATYYKLTKNVVLARQTTVGVIVPFATPAGLTTGDAVPLPERYFGGGSLSDRAFPENQAGPRDIGIPAGPGAAATQPTGFPLGGNAEFFNNIELRFPLIGDNISGVVFHDAGNVYSSVGSMSFRVHQHDAQDFNYMVHAAGFGIRYKTPIGPVRADFAYSINPPRFVGFNGTLSSLLTCNPNVPPSTLPSACQAVPQGVSHFQFFFSIGQTF